MRVYYGPDFKTEFKRLTPVLSDETRAFMDEFMCALADQLDDAGATSDHTFDETTMRVVAGIHVSGWVPLMDGGLELCISTPLEAEADYSLFPYFPCIQRELDRLTERMEKDWESGHPGEETGTEEFYEFVDLWNEDPEFADYVLEIWKPEDRDILIFQAYISLSEEKTCVRQEFDLDNLPDAEEAAKDLIGVIISTWEEKI